MIVTILFTISVFLGIGIISGGLFVYIYLNQFKTDKEVSIALSCLPGFDCGACTYASCQEYAIAIINSNERLDRCLAGDSGICNSLEDTLGKHSKKIDNFEKAYIACNEGIASSKIQFPYDGLQNCSAASSFFGGMRSCKSGCLGFGSCISSCPSMAIGLDSSGLAWINQKKCTGCRKCLDSCPRGLIRIVSKDATHFIACASESSSEIKTAICGSSCIVCYKCEELTGQGILIRNNLAQILSNSLESNDIGASICPTKVIKKFDDIKKSI